MNGLIDEQKGDAHYNEFYAGGGWKYSFWKEFWWHRRHLVKRFGLRRGMKVLEVACGNGFHTHLLNRMGFECTGVDRSRAGIDWAQRHFPKWTYHCRDFRDIQLPPQSFDMVLARGFSYYHYDMNSPEAHEATQTLIPYVRPGGVFVMIIVTDLSGKRVPGAIWHNKLDDYRNHFTDYGSCKIDWVDGMVICGLYPHGSPTDQRSVNEQKLGTSKATIDGMSNGTRESNRRPQYAS